MPDLGQHVAGPKGGALAALMQQQLAILDVADVAQRIAGVFLAGADLSCLA